MEPATLLRDRLRAESRRSLSLADLVAPRPSLEATVPHVPGPRVVVRREGRAWIRGAEGEGALRDVTLIRPVRPLQQPS